MDTIGIDHVNLLFPRNRLEEVLDFYVDTLGFETSLDDPYEDIHLDPGLFTIDVGGGSRIFVNPSDEFDPDAANYRHVAVRVAESPETVESTLADASIPIENEAQWERAPFGSYTSYYVSDPFGYTIEFMAVGPDQG